jgi:tight adherence protein C
VELAIFTGVAVFILITSFGMLLFHGESETVQVASAFQLPIENRRKKSLQQVTVSMGRIVERFDGVMRHSESDVKSMTRKLMRAGFRNENAVRIFFGAQVVSALLLPALLWISHVVHQNLLLVLAASAVIGYMLPGMWLSRSVTKRHKTIRLSLPDVLDLLIVCVEAGLSLDQATIRTAEEIGHRSPIIADELNVVVLEQRAGCARTEAWRHFADRANIPSVKNVVAMLVQSEQFGTSIAKTLRVHSEALRTQRIQQAEEMAAKTGIKMLIPLVLFIFPVIFVVTLGPVVIMMIETFSK